MLIGDPMTVVIAMHDDYDGNDGAAPMPMEMSIRRLEGPPDADDVQPQVLGQVDD